MKKITSILIGAGNRGMQIYAPYAKKYPNELQFVAVVEPDGFKRNKFIEEYNIEPQNAFESYEALFEKEKIADCVFICTQDNMHFEPTMSALEKGYDVLLEKPISGNKEELILLNKQAHKYNCHLAIAHVLRYSEFFAEIKKTIDSGILGRITSIQHSENIGFWHYAHSFVRGHWRDSKVSNPIVLAKSCHDMDILTWFADSDCDSISSFGVLKEFTKENKPKDAADRCFDCDIKNECQYSALDIYEMPKAYQLKNIITSGANTIIEELDESNFGKCVYDMDNNVMDTQVTIIKFANDVYATFHLTAFSNDISRRMRIFGTKGELYATTEDRKIIVYDFLTDKKTEISIKEPSSGHEGGDFGLIKDFLTDVRANMDDNQISSKTSIDRSIMSHLMALAAEESRVKNNVVDLNEFIQ